MTKSRFLSFFYKDKALTIYWVVVFVLSFLMLFSHSISFLDPDFGWHIRVGKDISLSGSAPTIETYTYPTEGDSWVDPPAPPPAPDDLKTPRRPHRGRGGWQ